MRVVEVIRGLGLDGASTGLLYALPLALCFASSSALQGHTNHYFHHMGPSSALKERRESPTAAVDSDQPLRRQAGILEHSLQDQCRVADAGS